MTCNDGGGTPAILPPSDRRHPPGLLSGEMMSSSVSNFVDGQRLWSRLMRLAEFGATPRGGVSRLALTEEEVEARAELVRWAQDIGLEVFVDDAANLFLCLTGQNPELPPLLMGSHIDTQPTGGKFDGAYGVVAAIESLHAIALSGRRPRRSMMAVAWMNEEGSRFAPGMMGSAVFTKMRKFEDILAVRDKKGHSVREALDGVLEIEKHLPRKSIGFALSAYLEAHIEQGPKLEAHGKTIGVVTGIQGKRTFRVEVQGEESHAGTSPRRERRDALVSAVAIVKSLQRAMWDEEDAVRFTIGSFTVEPNAPSVVPGRVVFSIDLRHHAADVVRDLGDKIAEICQEVRGKCEVKVAELLNDPPLQFPMPVRERIAEVARKLGLAHEAIASPAGHDARYLHYVCPTGMIFIPCKQGISHNEAESITPLDAESGARVLADVAFELAELP
jgi:beta-ureidopropionase / N-carbamoyl-L-amino-acid hydrolase